MGFSIVKFLTGFNIFDGAKLGKLVFYFILIACAIGVYHKTFIAPTSRTNIISPKEVNVYTTKPKPFILLKIWKLHLLSIE